MNNKLPSLFIGSSSEDLEIARGVELQLQNDARVSIWKNWGFDPGDSTLETLMKALDEFDFAIMVLNPNDLLRTRGRKYGSPRDNVLFELGLFMGRIGRHRTFILHEEGADLKLPTDLNGITRVTYRKRDRLADALSPACSLIAGVIKNQGPFVDYPWLYTDGRLEGVEARIECKSIWVVSPTLHHDTQHLSVIEIVKNNLRRGISYTIIFPDNRVNAPFRSTLRSIFASHPKQLMERPIPEDQFNHLAVTHFLFLDPEADSGNPPRVFIELPIPSLGHWVEVDTPLAREFVGRFYQIAKGT